MNIGQITSIFLLLSSLECDGGKPSIPGEKFDSSLKPYEEQLSDDKVKLISKLLESKSQRNDETIQGAAKADKKSKYVVCIHLRSILL